MTMIGGNRRLLTAGLAGVVALTLGCDSGTSPTEADPFDAVRRLTAPFQNLDAARAAGYTVWSPDPIAPGATCATSPEGRMGYHLVNTALRGSPGDPVGGDAVIDSQRPEMLLFEKRADGSLRLVGVEYLVFKAAWERTNPVGSVPIVLGHPLLLSRHSFVTGGPEIDHYELHVWVHSTNRHGMTHPWNPDISC